MLLLTFSLPKTSHAYYAKAFKAGSITAFNHFYTRHNNGINTLYSCNDIEVGFNKNLWAEFELSFMYGHSKINHQQAFGLNYFSVRFFSPIYQGERHPRPKRGAGAGGGVCPRCIVHECEREVLSESGRV